MRKGILIFLVMAAGAVVLMYHSCDADYLVYENIPIPDTVSFLNDIVPVFDANCNMSGCHSRGNYTPYLTKEEAYLNLTAYGLVDISDPETSVLYKRLVSITNPMPPDGNLPENKTELILAWISQGAIDN